MPLKIQEKTYIDSNIWFAYITNNLYGSESIKAHDILYSIVNDERRIAVISQLVIIEVINVIRTRIIQRTPYENTLETTKINTMRQIISDHIKKFIDVITRWTESKKLEVFTSNTAMKTMLYEIMKVQNNLKGEIKVINQCKFCGTHYNSYVYKGVDHWDIQHALIAREAGVNYFVTFDKGYEELRKYFKEFKLMIY